MVSSDEVRDEWDTAIESIGRFDGILVDLKKYGFSFVTGLATAQGLFGFTNANPWIRIGAVIMTMLLVVMLYWLDKYYFSLLMGSYIRARFLEKFRLTNKLSLYTGFPTGDGVKTINTVLYFSFLGGLFVLGIFVTGNDQTLIILFSIATAAILGLMMCVRYRWKSKIDSIPKHIFELYDKYYPEVEKVEPWKKDDLIKKIEEEIFHTMYPDLEKKSEIVKKVLSDFKT